MFLAPGRYRLSWRTVNEASDETGPTNMLGGVGVPRTERGGLFWTISCPGLKGTELATAAAERTDAKGRPVADDLDVPADRPATQSTARRVGNRCVMTCSSGGWQ